MVEPGDGRLGGRAVRTSSSGVFGLVCGRGVMGVSFNVAKPADLVASPSSTVSYLRFCANT